MPICKALLFELDAQIRRRRSIFLRNIVLPTACFQKGHNFFLALVKLAFPRSKWPTKLDPSCLGNVPIFIFRSFSVSSP